MERMSLYLTRRVGAYVWPIMLLLGGLHFGGGKMAS
jgi:hypothetical protein